MTKKQLAFNAWFKVFIIFSAFISINASAADKNNFDGSYNIKMEDSKCGNLGYAFKLKHERDGLSKQSAMFKSNCKTNSNGQYEGYIYPKKVPTMRIFWVETSQGVTYKD
ncbi:MAG: hypothetical protein K9L65_03025 [Chromatiaceae bacterium]|nr:hypothetical protein [Chromatiaceae bacterium]